MSFNRPSSPPERHGARPNRPSLWAEGAQQPRFDLRAFARVSLILSRRAARPALLGTAGFVDRSAPVMAENQLGPWLAQSFGWVGRTLPSRDSLATGLHGFAALLSAAADVAEPPPPVIETPAYPDLFRPSEVPIPPLVRRPRRAIPRLPDPEPIASSHPTVPSVPTAVKAPSIAAKADFDEPTLAAIRAMIDDMRGPPVVALQRSAPVMSGPPRGRALLIQAVPLSPPEPREPNLREKMSRHARQLAAATVGWGLCVLMLPIGAVKAGLLHLGGENLRNWS